MIASFELEFSAYAVKGNASQPKASAVPSGVPAEAAADEEEAEDDDQVEGDRRRVGSRKRVPLAGPERGRARPGRRRGRPSARRCRRGRWRTRSGRSSGSSHGSSPSESAGPHDRPRVVDRHVAVRRLAVEDPVAADHARVADVDDAAGILEVEPDPQAAEEDGDRREQPDRPRERRVEGAAAEADPRRADDEVRERRRPERGAPNTSPRLKNQQREPERQRARAGRAVCHERSRRRSMRPRTKTTLSEVQVHQAFRTLPPNEPTRPARHAPRHLRAGPRLDHAAVGIVDLPERDLAGTPRPDLHLPPPRRLVERRIRLRIRRVAVEPVRHLRDRRGTRSSTTLLVSRPAGDRSTGGERLRRPSWRRPVRRLVAVGAACRRRRRRARAAARAPRRTPSASPAERPELVADEVERRHEDDRDRLREDLADAGLDEQVQDDEVRDERRASRRRGTAAPGAPTWPRSTRNVQCRFSV